MIGRPPDEYSGLSMRALQAVALVAFAHWARTVRWEGHDVDALREHLWAWMSVAADTFDDWYAYDSDLLRAALAGDVSPELRNAWQALGLETREALGMLEPLVEVTHGSLFAAANLERAHEDMQRVLRIAWAAGTYVPPAEPFRCSLATDDDAWGHPADSEVATWRALERA